MTGHLAHKQLLDYLFEEGPPEEMEHVSAHLDACPECRSRWLRLCQESRKVDNLIDSVTAAEFGRLVRKLQEAPVVTRGLASILRDTTVPDAIIQAAHRVLNDIAEGSVLVVRGLLDHGRHVAALAGLQVPLGQEFQLRPAFAGIGDSDAVRQAEAGIASASSCLSRGDSAGALETLARVSGGNARVLEAVEAKAQAGGLSLWFTVASGRRQVVLTCSIQGGVKIPQAAVLVPLDAPEKRVVAPFERVEEEASAIAQFEDVPDGAFDLVLLGSP